MTEQKQNPFADFDLTNPYELSRALDMAGISREKAAQYFPDNALAKDQKDRSGFWAQLGDKTLDTIGSTVTFGGAMLQKAGQIEGNVQQFIAQNIGNEKIDPNDNPYEKPHGLLNSVGKGLYGAGHGLKNAMQTTPEQSFDSIRDKWKHDGALSGIVEGLKGADDFVAQSFPYTLGIMAAPIPTYVGMLQDSADSRMKNDGRSGLPSWNDYAVTAPTTAAQAVLERYSAGTMLPFLKEGGVQLSKYAGKTAAGKITGLSLSQAAKETGKGMAKASFVEGTTEFGQQLVQDFGEQVGTKKGYDFGKSLENAGWATLAGILAGGAMRGGTSLIDVKGAYSGLDKLKGEEFDLLQQTENLNNDKNGLLDVPDNFNNLTSNDFQTDKNHTANGNILGNIDFNELKARESEVSILRKSAREKLYNNDLVPRINEPNSLKDITVKAYDANEQLTDDILSLYEKGGLPTHFVQPMLEQIGNDPSSVIQYLADLAQSNEDNLQIAQQNEQVQNGQGGLIDTYNQMKQAEQDAINQKAQEQDQAFTQQENVRQNQAMVDNVIKQNQEDLAYQQQAQADQAQLAAQQAQDEQARIESEKDNSLVGISKRLNVKAKRKRMAKKLKQQGFTHPQANKILGAIAAQKEQDLAEQEATAKLQDQENYQPNNVFADALVNFKPIKKMLDVEPETKQQNIEKIKQVIGDELNGENTQTNGEPAPIDPTTRDINVNATSIEQQGMAESTGRAGNSSGENLPVRDERKGNDVALVEHTTKRGKVLKGVVRTDLTKDQAEEISPYTFKKDGGYFIREQHLDKLKQYDNREKLKAKSKHIVKNEVDKKANEAATSPLNNITEPSEKQKEANNYKLGRIEHSGFNIGIENPQGSERSGISPDGKQWSNTMQHHYGDITGTKGADGDALDVFVNPSTTTSDKVFVVNQINPKSGKFDEHKVMLGFNNVEKAKKAYHDNYDKNWQGMGDIKEVSLDEFKQWTKTGDTTKPFKDKNIKSKTSAKKDELSSLNEITKTEEKLPTQNSEKTTGNFADHLYHEVSANRIPKNAIQLKQQTAKYYGIEPKDVTKLQEKQAQEHLEAALVKQARDHANSGDNSKNIIDKLISLYEKQPNLNIKTAKSSKNMAFSTPAPLSYLVNLVAGISKNDKVYEPTAGNGLLLMTNNINNTTVNEIDAERVDNLTWLGYKNVTNKDALVHGIVADKSQDVVIMNPPFGFTPKPLTVKGNDGLEYTLKDADHVIAAQQLEAMKDDGNAVLILGANKQAGVTQGGKTGVFLNWLYNNYNVVDHVELDGKVYSRQGAEWPIRIITIRGRNNTDTNYAPSNGTVERLSGTNARQIIEGLYERYQQNGLLDTEHRKPRRQTKNNTNDRSRTKNRDNTTSDQSGRVEQDLQSDRENDTKRAAVDDGGSRPTNAKGNGDGASSDSGRVDERTSGSDRSTKHSERKPAMEKQDISHRQERSSTNGRAGRDTNNVIGRLKKVKPVNEFQAQYIPASSGFNDNVLIPINMAGKIQKALTKLIKAVGNVDEYVAEKLGYDSISSVHDAFMALQVDAVAMAIYKAEQGKAIIIADQTGVGKGRQAAALMRYALKQGKTPVFFSQKANLFSDIYENLADIGTHDIKPFIINNGEAITYDNKTLFKLSDKVRKKHLANLTKGKLPENTNAVFLTYSQIQTPGAQQKALSAIADNAFFILDESHTAAGNTSSTGAYLKSLLNKAAGTLYLSATYAKRPDQLALYYKTSLGQAVGNMDELSEAISNGGLQLQTLLSSMLSEEGELIRRERSFDGITIASKIDNEHSIEHEQSFDKVTNILQKITALNKAFVRHIKAENKKAKNGSVLISNGTVDKMNPFLFSSVVHNYIAQLTMALKADAAANEAIKAIKQGQKPVIALESTLESKLDHFMANNHKAIGDSVSDFGFADILYDAIDNALSLSEKLPNGKTQKVPVKLSDLPSGIVAIKNEIESLIDNTELDAPVSPIDIIRKRITDAGYSVEEVTGRSKIVDYDDNMTVINKPKSENKANRRKVIDRFNNGKTHVLILNQAGSTGLSIHASETFADKRQRHMIVAQPSLDINTFMQMLGRINRTGQVELPSYDILWLDLPSENRPATVLSNKMKGLNAQTSANTDSANDIESMDMFNAYGDIVVTEYFEDNPELLNEIGVNLPNYDVAQYITGKLAILPVSKQREFFADVEPRYKEYIDYLKSIGEYSLETKEVDLDAKPLKQSILHKGEGNSVFDSDIKLTKSDIKKQGRSPSFEDFEAAIDNIDTQKIPNELDALNSKFDAYIAKRFDKDISDAKDEDSAKALQNKKGVEKSNKYITEQELRYKFKLGSSIILSINDEKINGLIADIKIKPSKKGNPYAKSNFVYTILTASGHNKLKLSYSQLEKITETTGNLSQSYLGKIFKSEHDKPLRENRYIITGNLVKAFSMINGGKVVSFTQHDGSNNVGILLPKGFKKDNDISKSYYITSFDKGLNYLKETNDAILQGQGIKNSDGFTINLIKGDLNIGIPVNNAAMRKKYLTDDIQVILGKELAWRKGQKIVYTSINQEQGKSLFALVKEVDPFVLTNSAADEYNRINNIKDQSKEVNTKDIAFSKTAPTTVMADSVPKKHLTLEQTNEVVQNFINDYNGNFPLNFEVVNDQAEVYKENGTVEKIGLVKGAYHPQSGKVVITAMGMQTVADGRETLRHEVLGHYGLNTFKPEDKKGILQRIINSKNSTDLKPHWDRANKDYDGKSELEKAEEVFAFIAEQQPTKTTFWQNIVDMVRKALRAIGIGKGVISKREIQSLIKTIGKQIKSGKAKQQTLPSSDQSQFRKENSQSTSEKNLFGKVAEHLPESLRMQDNLGLLMGNQIKKVYGKLFNSDEGNLLTSFDEQVKKMTAYINKVSNKAEKEIEEVWDSFQNDQPKESELMSDLMVDATMTRLDGAIALEDNPVYTKAIEKLDSINEKIADIEDTASKMKSPTTKMSDALARLNNAAAKVEADIEQMRDNHKKLNKRFEQIGKRGQELYIKVREFYKEMWNDSHQALLDRINDLDIDAKQKAALTAKIDAMFHKSIEQGVYFPLARFGDYAVIVKDSEGNVVQRLHKETEKDAQILLAQLQKEYPDHKVLIDYTKKQGSYGKNNVTGFAKDIIAKIAPMLDGEQIDLNLLAGDSVSEQVLDTIYQSMLRAMPTSGASSQLIHRKYIMGASKDSRRAFASTVQNQTNKTAKIKFEHKIRQVIDKMDALVNDDDYDQKEKITARKIVEHIKAIHEDNMKGHGDGFHSFAAKLNNFLFMFHLGGSVGAAVVNSTQNFLIGIPVLGSKFGFVEAHNEIQKAQWQFMKEAKRSFNRSKLKDAYKNMSGAESWTTLSTSDELSKDEKAIILELHDDGDIELTQTAMLGQTAETDMQTKAIGSRRRIRLTRAMGSFFHNAEVMNREVMALAAMRLLKKKNPNATKAELKSFASEMISDVHFDYSSTNRAMVMRKAGVKMIATFKTYTQNMMFLLNHSVYKFFSSASTKEEKAEAGKVITGILASHMIIGGAAALPLYGVLFSVINGLNSLFSDDDDDLAAQWRTALDKNISPEFADVIFKGIPAALGIELSNRISIDGLIYRKSYRELHGDAQKLQIIKNIFGAGIGTAMDVYSGISSIGEGISEGNYTKAEKGAEKLLPKFARDPVKAIRRLSAGEKSYSGDEILSQDEFTSAVGLWRSSFQFVGLSPSKLSDIYDKNNAVIRSRQAKQGNRSLLMKRYYNAISNNSDEKVIDEILNDIVIFSQNNPEYGISNKQLIRGYKTKISRSARTKTGLYTPKTKSDANKYQFN